VSPFWYPCRAVFRADSVVDRSEGWQLVRCGCRKYLSNINEEVEFPMFSETHGLNHEFEEW